MQYPSPMESLPHQMFWFQAAKCWEFSAFQQRIWSHRDNTNWFETVPRSSAATQVPHSAQVSFATQAVPSNMQSDLLMQSRWKGMVV